MDPASPEDPSLKYARVETERRFLVRTLPDGAGRVSGITDRYIEGTRLRLREVTTEGTTTRKLGHKVRLSTGPARVAHTSIYLDDTEWAVLCALPTRIVRKRRHHVQRDGVAFAIDEFADGSLVAEFDGGDVRPGDPPAWLDVIREVTNDEAFTGGGRARDVGPVTGHPGEPPASRS
jgi:CYTH domain-containing protein